MMFRFTIRDLLWLTVVVAIAVGAWLERRYLASENARLAQQLKIEERRFVDLISIGPPVTVFGPNTEMPIPSAPAPNSPKK